MEEKDQNKLTIEDILDQLVKPSVIETPTNKTPVQSIPQEGGPALDSIKSKISLGTESDIRLPTLKTGLRVPVSKPIEVNVAQPPSSLPASPSSELKLSIRTMADDLNELRGGEKPLGFEIGKVLNSEKIQEDQKLPPTPSSVFKQADFLRPNLSPLPEKLSATKMPPLAKISLPPLQMKEKLQELPVLGMPQKSDTQTKSIDEEKIEYRAIMKVVSSGMTTGVLTTLAVAVAIYFLLSVFVFNKKSIVIPTLTPTIVTSNAPVLEINELDTIFNVPEISFSFPESSQEATPKFKLFVSNQIVVKNQFKRIGFTISGQARRLMFNDILGEFMINLPVELAKQLKENNAVFLYGQKEVFNENGESVADESDNKRLVFVVEVKNKNTTLEIMKSWEPAMPNSLKNIFDFDISKQISSDFLDNRYQNVDIRYKNFPFPDRSIDYTVATSPGGRYYLLLVNSRESMYSPLDKILGAKK